MEPNFKTAEWYFLRISYVLAREEREAEKERTACIIKCCFIIKSTGSGCTLHLVGRDYSVKV
jgi:hypothetical protein